jgi:hypothetical protein
MNSVVLFLGDANDIDDEDDADLEAQIARELTDSTDNLIEEAEIGDDEIELDIDLNDL